MQGVTGQQLLTALVVIVALIGVYNAVMTAIRTHRDEQERKANPTTQLMSRVAKCQERIEQLQKSNRDHNDEMKLILRSQLALLRHGIDGNNIDGLKDCQTEIQSYLVNR